MTTKGQSAVSMPIGEASPQDRQAGRPRVFILSDVRLVCEGLVVGLSYKPNVIVVGSSDLSGCPTKISESRPDVVLLDVAGAGNIQLSRPLRELLPSVKIVAFAVADREELIIACAEAGISGYVPRTASLEDVVAAVHAAIRGELHCSPRTAGLLFSHMALRPRKRAPAAVPYVLTQREKEILALVEQGFSNKEIGRFLRIGHATVKNHVHSILGKLQVRRRGEAAAWVRQADIDHYGRDRSLSPSASTAASLHGPDHRN